MEESFWDFKSKDPLIDSWFLMRSPVPLLGILLVYFLILWIGPKVLKHRPPMKLDRILTVYNILQMIYSFGICYAAPFKLNVFSNGILYAGCQYPHDTKDEMVLQGGWWYFFAKVTELLDTVFFVLRKKDKQIMSAGARNRHEITFLHVYHHVSMVLYTWSYLKYAAGGDGIIHAFMNGTVHLVMYTYYLLAGLGPNFQKYLWWKEYVTKMQMLQLAFILTYNIHVSVSPRCNVNQFFVNFISFNTMIYLILFIDFYFKNYKRRVMEKKEVDLKDNVSKNFELKNETSNEKNTLLRRKGFIVDSK